MNLIRKILKQALVWLFVASFAFPAEFASADIYPSPIQAMTQILEDLGVDKESLRINISNTSDVLNYKKPLPTVSFSFVPASPTPGKELTAMAVPANFTGNPEQMYFTWYLKHESGNRDWNRDGRVNIEDYKIAAMRILAKGDWEPDYARFGIIETTADADNNGYADSFDAYYNAVNDTDEDGYEAVFGGDDQRGKSEHCFERNMPRGTDIEIDCEHFFPDTNGYGRVGDGNFGRREEKFWGTDPESKDTNNDGVPDEAALAGKGMMAFKWIYQEGDQIGVIVEGVADSTDYEDSSFKTMWAHPNNDPGGFIDPAQGTLDKKIGVSFSYLPQNPINDPTGNNSDELRINSILSNVENKSFVKYQWSFYTCSDIAGTTCSAITANRLRDMGMTKSEGLGLGSMIIRLDLPSTDYLKVELRVIETTEQASGKSGQGKIIIPLQETDDAILPFNISVTDADTVSLSQGADRYPLDEILTACPNKACPVLKNEIIGARLNRQPSADEILSWSLDGKPIVSSRNNPGRVYFPVLKDAGSTYSLKLDITTMDGTELEKDKTTVIRDFEVEEPQVDIMPQNCSSDNSGGYCRPAEIGNFIDPYDPDNETLWERDFSQDLFQAERGNALLIEPHFNFDPSILEDEDMQGNTSWKFRWKVDGIAVDPTSTDPNFPRIDASGNLNLPINKELGEKYSVSIEALYTQPALVKKALFEIWNIPKESFYEKIVSDSLEIEVVADGSIQARSGTGKVLASLFAGMPEYLNFLLRIVLTLALVIFMANLSLVFFPKKN